ncbi:hypothetical protein [Paracoccus homiensis]|uniref:Right handed beta helix region n=1 Tax=Paracoccus homiensis TaxID=364199 RepID=A0A1I0J347_9RHOB|nr:hypothetical protein [Paracoccus homiensis]SEU03473.1 hypothetical protein SAMN04489858_12073 [Paracoccus homiensis]
MRIKPNFKTGTDVTISKGGETAKVERWGVAHRAYPAIGGRIKTLSVDVSNLSAGIKRPRSDGKTTLDLSAEERPGNLTFDIPGGRVGVVDVRPQQQRDGWGNGDHYWLETDEQGRFIIEPGRRHRKFYVSESSAAMTKAQVAADAGVSESTVTEEWMLTHLEYASEAKPIRLSFATELAYKLYWVLQPHFIATPLGRSDWWLYERGYEYEGIAGQDGTSLAQSLNILGESSIHPILHGAWGTGPKPHFRRAIAFRSRGPQYLIARDLHSHGSIMRDGRMVAVENCEWHGPDGGDQEMTRNYLCTLKDTDLAFPWRTAHVNQDPNNTTTWDASNNRGGGVYSAEAMGLLLHGNTVYHSGWADGYRYDMSLEGPQPPSQYSHGFYIADNDRHLTARYNILTENSSFGGMYRCGGFVHDNLYIDNNIPCTDLGSDYKGRGFIGQYSLHLDNLATSSAYKRVAAKIGAYNWGFRFEGKQISRVGNIICHLSDPNDPADIAAKPEKNYGVLYPGEPEHYYDDTIEYRWGVNNRNIEGKDTAVLDQTTIQNYARDELGLNPPTIREFSLYCLGRDTQAIAQDVNRYFKQGFGVYAAPRSASASVTFRPDDRGEGFRWDNRLNWTTTDLPGVEYRDSVDLDGQYVKFGTIKAHVTNITGMTERLQVTSGHLTTDNINGPVEVAICGQLHVGGGNINALVRGGRLAFTGSTSGSVTAYGLCEVLLGPDFTVTDRLEVQGEDCWSGWDGAGSPTLTVNGTLAFRPGLKVDIKGGDDEDDLYRGHFFYDQTIGTGSISGATYEAGQMRRIGPTYSTLYNITGNPVVGDRFIYRSIEKVRDGYEYDPDTGTAANPGLRTTDDYYLEIAAIKSAALPQLRRFKRNGDDPDPTCTPTVTLASGSVVEVMDTSRWPSGTHYLTGTGITVTDNGATLPSGVSVTGGRLAYTKA